MVEEYMEGSEVSVETLSVNGVCHVIQITDKLTTDAPYFVENGTFTAIRSYRRNKKADSGGGYLQRITQLVFQMDHPIQKSK